MSADFINSLGARGPQLRESFSAGQRPAIGAADKANQAGDASSSAGSPSTVEGFAPTSEVGESSQDRQAGEARASEIFSAWAPAQAGPSASAGQLKIQGGENTAISHQVHSTQNGQHAGTAGPEAGFSEATTYSSRPPQ